MKPKRNVEKAKNKILRKLIGEIRLEKKEKPSMQVWSNWYNWTNWTNWSNWNNWWT